ncbi:MAG: sensor histidine kinase [Methylovulum sp.]|nr:sensor histidine kinase [Methylovulum sp.]
MNKQPITLFQWVWRAYFKASLIPLLALEIALISVYFLSNQFSNQENIGTIRDLARQELTHLSTREATGINHHLDAIANATRYLQDYSAAVMSARTPALKDDPGRFAQSPEGPYYTVKDTGGSAVFYSGAVPIGKAEREKAWRSAALDPALIGIKKAFPLVSQTYINTHDSLNRIYPYFDVIAQYPKKMSIPSFNFYYEADAAHNPKRGTVWTDVYIDPAGLGWMTSCIAPVYNAYRRDFLEGVVGIDMTIKAIIDEVEKLEIPWQGYGVLISRSGTILALPKVAERDWGIQGLSQSHYASAIKQDTFRAENYNAYANPALAQTLKNAESGFQQVQLSNASLLAWATIPATGWKIIIVAPEAHIFKPVTALADRLNQITWLMVAGMLIFYSLFFLMLSRRAKKMSLSISKPLTAIDTIVATIAAGLPVTTSHDFVVAELASTANGILDMGIQLESAKQSRDQAAAELHKKAEQMQVIFDVSPIAYVLVNDCNDIVLSNNAFSQLTSITQQEALTMTETGFLQRLSSQAKTPLELSSATGNRQRIELVRPRPTSLLCGMREIYLQKHTVLGKVYFLHDITKDEEIDRIKNDFMAHATHELRTPLTCIMGYSELLLAARISADRQPAIVALIHEQSAHLVKMLNELLDLTKIAERAGADFTILPHSLTGIIEDVIDSYIAPESRNGILFYPPESNVAINADGPRFKRALLNIIDNAYRYSPIGSDVSVTVTYLKDSQMAAIEIKDHGIGMSVNERAQAFDRFYRADKSGNIPGTGLGLSLAKEILALLDGAITIDSAPGAGTTVTVTLPVVQ